MFNLKSDWTVRIGLFLVTLAWFSFTFYEFMNSVIHGGTIPIWILITDTSGALGFGFRAAASFVALITVLFYVVKRDLSLPEALMSARWVILLEAAYWVSLLPSGLWGLIGLNMVNQPVVTMTVETTIPLMVESIAVPVVLARLFFELTPNKASKGLIKWGLISGTVYVFVFWLNNTSNWIAALMEKGITYISVYPANLFSFLFTSVGLLSLALFTAYFSKKSIGKEDLKEINLHTLGVIVTSLGLYFDVIYVLWLFLGNVGGFGTWYAWFLGHNMDLWTIALPFIGLPLLFQKKPKISV
jgi:hypothetical protein